MDKRRSFDAEGFVLIGCAVAVAIGRQWWRASHRLHVSMLSAEAFKALLPDLAIVLVVAGLAVGYSLFVGKRKSKD